jgi:tight adherence protein C
MIADLGWALLAGSALGLGLWCLAGLVPALSPPRLELRLARQLADLSAEARAISASRAAEPLPVLGALVLPVLAGARSLLDRVLGGRGAIERRLRESGSPSGVDRYRGRQLLFAIAGVVAGLLLALGFATGGAPLVAVVLPIAGAAGGVALSDALLARAARARLRRMAEELPTVLEFLLLALSAGEGLHDALRRVGRIGSGALATELGHVMTAVETGVPLATALTNLAEEVRLSSLARAVDHLVSAIERGSPLVEVLRAQAEDCRAEAKRGLLEQAGKKEVGMLVPLVFLILPLTVAIAIWPGLVVLQTGF